MKEKRKVVGLSVAIVVGILLGISLSSLGVQQINVEVETGVTGYVEYRLKRAGETEFVLLDANSNLITTLGKKAIRDHLGWTNATGQETNVTGYISLSNDTPANASDTQLSNEVTGNNLTRALGAISLVNTTAYQAVFTFIASGTETVQCSGLHWSGVSDSDANLFACNLFTQVTLYDDDQLEITWTIQTA